VKSIKHAPERKPFFEVFWKVSMIRESGT